MSELSILHLSDLHRDPANPIGNQPLIESMIRDYQKYTKEESPAVRPPDIVVVSGDIIYGIRSDTDDPEGELARQYDEAIQFLTNLTDMILAGDRRRVVIVPGNHDVSSYHARSSMRKIPITSDSKKDLVSRLFSYNSPLRWAWPEFELYEIYDRQAYDKRFEAFCVFYGNFYGNQRRYSLVPNEQYDIFDYPEFNVIFSAFNSCYNNDILNRQGTIHPDCIAAASRILRDPRYQDRIRIGVWHHNIEGGPSNFDYMDPDVMQNLIDSGFSLGLHGHHHKPQFIDLRFAHGGDRHITVLSAGTVCGQAAPRFGRSYNLVEIHPEERVGVLHLREMQNDKLDSPIWGQRSLPPNNSTFLEFTFDPPPEPLVRVPSDSAALKQADLLFSDGKYDEAAAILNPIASTDELARRILLECYIRTNNSAAIVANFDPPQSSTEIISLMDALWEEADTDRLVDLIKDSTDAGSIDTSVGELIQKYKARLRI